MNEILWIYGSTLFAHTGTHSVTDVTITQFVGTINITTTFSERSTAMGALICFIFIENGVHINFMRSAVVTLDRKISHNYELPFNLFQGVYQVFVYDIEEDGTLANGVGYPAVIELLLTNGNFSGSCIIMLIKLASYLLCCRHRKI